MPGQYPENPKVPAPRRDPAVAVTKIWLWVCVGTVSAIILVLWGWATSISLSSFNWSKTPEKKLIDKSQNNWNTLFNDEKSKIQKEQIKLQLKNILNTITTQTNTTTSATSTINITTTNSTTASSTP